jgi:predicted DCC family thiol-disulfide oxidoreductase YuxK
MDNLIIFDGECNFCNFYINKLIDLDTKKVFRFTPYESEFAIKTMTSHGIALDFRESFILMENDAFHLKSSAVIKILSKLSPLGKITALSMKYLVPKILRDKVYDYVAKNRYKISKHYDSCRLPTPELRERFVN